MKEFFIVQQDGNWWQRTFGPQSWKLGSLGTAKAEAKRLCNTHKHKRFVVLQSVGYAHIPRPRASWRKTKAVKPVKASRVARSGR